MTTTQVIRERDRRYQRNCGHFRQAPARFEIRGGGLQVRRTCLDCGKRIGRPEPLSEHPALDSYPLVIAAPPAKRSEPRRVDYDAYLASPEWAERRAYYIAKALHRCELCGWEPPAGSDGQGLDVHHRTYERLGREFDADVIVLCRRCHERFHDIGAAA